MLPKESKKEEKEKYRIQKLIENQKPWDFINWRYESQSWKSPVSNIVAVFGEYIMNKNWEVLREFVTFNELKITNTFFRKKDVHKYSWSATGLISYRLCKKVSRKLAKQIIDKRVYRRHTWLVLIVVLIVSKTRLYTHWKPTLTSTKQENEEVFNVYLLEQESIWRLYQDRMRITNHDIEKGWCNIKHSKLQSVKETIVVKKVFWRRRSLRIWAEVEEALTQKQKAYFFSSNSY